jgi:hypothetical protein
MLPLVNPHLQPKEWRAATQRGACSTETTSASRSR